MKELMQLRNEPPEGIRIVTPDDNMLDITGIIEGPADTPYEGGYFKVKFNFTEEFPAAPPKCWFATKIFHPNVSSAGEICVNTLKKDWQSSFGIAHILVTVKCLLIYPNPESALDEEAGKLLLEDYESYSERARLITSVHATPKTRPPEFTTPATSVLTASSSTSVTASTPSSKPAKTIEITTTLVSSYEAPAPLVASNTLSTGHAVFRKSASPSPQPAPQPLQMSASNASPIVSSTSEELLKTAGVAPLGRADANAPALGNAGKVASDPSKAVKRPAGGVGAGEKRKKALKRL
ncbi:ubiquitin-conjugating enzyme/RWD-like protein [Phellopilus nigrolimitatus]|nr:ubiquitin-conjugating enzyme/RWD-like protein [Phellopilus nigrolimitatus]